MKIYVEGYAVTGQRSGAIMLGEAPGDTLCEAADNLAQRDREFARYYDPAGPSYWGCKLFDNLSDAQRNFG